MIAKEQLEKLYLHDKISMMDIALRLDCSVNKVVYWMDKYQIKRRTISDAIYHRANPKGDPFLLKLATTLEEAKLLGLGIGLYWGEGTKASTHQVRLGNSDPALLKNFINFLVKICGVERSRLKFGLQIFTDINPAEALTYWVRELNVDVSQFYKVHVTISGSIGTYRKRSKYGVVTVYFNNKKLRDILVGLLPS